MDMISPQVVRLDVERCTASELVHQHRLRMFRSRQSRIVRERNECRCSNGCGVSVSWAGEYATPLCGAVERSVEASSRTGKARIEPAIGWMGTSDSSYEEPN